MTTVPVTGASCHTTFNCMKSDIHTQLNKNIVYSSALQCKKVQSSIVKLHWSEKWRKTEIFVFKVNIRVPLLSVNLFLHGFVSPGHSDNGTLRKVTHNFHLKIRNILELTTCPVKFGTTCPSVIFFTCNTLTATMFEIFMLLISPRIR